MNVSDSTSSLSFTPVEFNLLMKTLGDATRCAILRELGAGEPLMVTEIAQRIRRSPSLVSKHIAVLRRAGVVVVGHAGCYQIPKQFLASPDKRHLDFGHCLLRLPDENGKPRL